jgi:hydroxymethylpyrimidine pyrophosphatase-like HAD family hydrolase
MSQPVREARRSPSNQGQNRRAMARRRDTAWLVKGADGGLLGHRSEKAPGAARSSPPPLLDSEMRFYGPYSWVLDACPTVEAAVGYLQAELARLRQTDESWQCSELRINVFLLACGITDAIDDYLAAERYDFSLAASVLPLAGVGVRAADALTAGWRTARSACLGNVRRWRKDWADRLDGFLKPFAVGGPSDPRAFMESAAGLASMLRSRPRKLDRRRLRIPAAFRTQDLTHFDIIALADKLARVHPDRRIPVVAVGLRTAGSYFAPLVRARLAHAGYLDTSWVTIRPKRDLAAWERATLEDVARRGGVAAIVDEPPNTGSTVNKAVGLVRSCGFDPDRQSLLMPIHPTRPDWAQGSAVVPLKGVRILTLEPGEWHKPRSLAAELVQRRIAEYFTARGYTRVRIVPSPTASAFNAKLQDLSEEKFHTRLKRVYEIEVQDDAERSETRYVMAKSVGWGWLGYHAFVVAERLSRFLPPVLGLRDGVLYTEWLPAAIAADEVGRKRLVSALGRYTAMRVKELGLECDPSPDLARADQHKGSAVLAEALSRVYGWKPAAILQQPRIRRELTRHGCSHPTLIDGKMRPQEWIASGPDLVKTDFEHHGLGKTELNVTDPAYDLADAILHFRLSPDEERALIREYVALSGDARVEARLFLHKLLAGVWAIHGALDNLADARLATRHREFNEQYLNARTFLTIHTTRRCATLCDPAPAVGWGSPLVVLDIDGVLDRLIFGFPSTTAAGIEAISLLHRHELAVALDTARSLAEVKEYCRAYGLVGGVAEYGAVVWDGATDRERVLAGDESLEQLNRARAALGRIPGVFLDQAYRYSIRAYAFERGTTVPLPTLLVRNLLAEIGADRIEFHQTFVDTTILPREVDKGRGLTALLELAGQTAAKTIAIGDSDADLAMFGAAGCSFAPSHLSCRSSARLLGCRIKDRPFQLGFLQAVRSAVHPRGGRCDRCRRPGEFVQGAGGLFEDLLKTADQPRWRLLLRAVLDPMATRAFAR